ncbi:MAG: glycoside hydrolase domain-containing protein, partial [Armatimonadota bacterium]
MRFAVILLLAACAAPTGAATPIDEHTTFLASFDRSVQPDYCAGDWRAAVAGEADLVPGRLGNAVSLRERQSLTYSAREKVNLAAGTVEFWLLWTQELAEAEQVSLFTMTTPEQGNYVNFNKIQGARLGMPVKGGRAEDFTWQRTDADFSNWQVGSWHHLAGTWEGGVTRLYADGRLAQMAEGGAGLVELPTQFSLGPGPLVIDELRISAIARPADELGVHAADTHGEATTMYLTELEPDDAGQAIGRVGIDAQTAIDEREVPLVIGTRAYARGLALRAPGLVEFTVPAGLTRLRAVCGLSPFGREGARATLTFSQGGREVRACSDLSHQPTPLEVTVEAGQALRIEAHAEGDPGAVVVVADALLLAEGAEPPPPFAREVSVEELQIQRMRTQVAQFEFELPPAPKGYVIYAGHPVDAIDPAQEPMAEVFPATLAMAAAPGEYEAVQFTLCAARDLPAVTVTASDLRAAGGALAADVQVQLVRRVLQRKGYWMPRAPENYETVSRFLMPNDEFWLPAGNLKEVYVLVHVPEEAAPGEYTGTITVAPEGFQPTRMALNLTVRPLTLVQPRNKRYGMYYRMASVADNPAQLDAEFADMAAHGCTMVMGHAAIAFARGEDGTITWDFGLIRTMLEAGRRHGFFGPITIYDNIPQLARLMGYAELDDQGRGEPISEKEDLLNVTRRCFAELKALNAEYPEYEFVLTHMDEVFGRGRLERYIDAAEVIRKTCDLRIYITMHMTPGRWEQYMERSDPWIDIRCINGHSLEEWLHAGNTWKDLAELLQASGDAGWIYHNMRGSFFKAEWNRFINGLFMWVSPLEVHVPWMYYSYGGDPFDDTDADGYDFGYAFP